MALISLTSCKQKTAEELIVAKWKCVDIDVSNLNRYVSDFEDKMGIEVLRSKYKESTAQFFKDKTYEQEITSYGYKENGEYKLINDGKNLICNHLDVRKNNKEEKFEIIGLSNDSLKLLSDDHYTIVFVKSKEK